MNYFARFEKIQNTLFRFDTRIYLNNYESNHSSYCIGAIVGKNPGSAKPKNLNKLDVLELDGDKMLPTVRNICLASFEEAGKSIPRNAFIRVWNLFYVCEPNLDLAISKMDEFKKVPVCKSESVLTPFTWYGWGGDKPKLNQFKSRFIEKANEIEFYYDYSNKIVKTTTPDVKSLVKHTQGMPSKPIQDYLATLI